MAADTQIPVTGKDTRAELLVAGVPVAVADQIVNFSAKRRVSRIETKVIGSSDVYIDQEPEGWEGDMELAVNRPGADTFIDAVDAAQRLRVPMSIQIVVTTYYRDGSSKTHVYPDVKVDFDSTARRGSANSVRIPWVCGVARLSI